MSKIRAGTSLGLSPQARGQSWALSAQTNKDHSLILPEVSEKSPPVGFFQSSTRLGKQSNSKAQQKLKKFLTSIVKPAWL